MNSPTSKFALAFLAYVKEVGIKDDTDLCALLSKALEKAGDEAKQLRLLDVAKKAPYPVDVFVTRLAREGVDVADLRAYLDARAKANAPTAVEPAHTEVVLQGPMSKLPQRPAPEAVGNNPVAGAPAKDASSPSVPAPVVGKKFGPRGRIPIPPSGDNNPVAPQEAGAGDNEAQSFWKHPFKAIGDRFGWNKAEEVKGGVAQGLKPVPGKGGERQKNSGGGKNVIWIGGVVLLVFLGIGAFLALNSYSGEGATSLQPENAPSLINPTPLNFVSNMWINDLLKMILVEFIGVLIYLLGDAIFREQISDAVVVLIVTAVFVFLPVSGLTKFYAFVIFAMGLGWVIQVTRSGGIDFTPIGGHLLLLGIFGGLILSKIPVIQTMLGGLPSSPVLPLVQMGIVFLNMDWQQLYFPMLIYLTIFMGLGFNLWEAFRPSGNGDAPVGSYVSAAVGLLFYFGLIHLVGLVGWISYIVAMSISIGVAGLLQKERKILTITVDWGTRSPFDGGMLITSVLIILHVCFGVVG